MQLESDALAAREAKLGEDRARLSAELDELLARQEGRLREWEGRIAGDQAALEEARSVAQAEDERCAQGGASRPTGMLPPAASLRGLGPSARAV